MGVPYEGVSRQKMQKNPIKDINSTLQNTGLWSDDSSLTLCLARSLSRGFDLDDLASRFIRWLDQGYMTPEGKAFGIGRTTYIAINNLKKGLSPLDSGLKDEHSNGNGSLMRVLPLAYYTCHMDKNSRFDMAGKVSAITHAHPRSIIACCIYVQMAAELFMGKEKNEAYSNMKETIKRHFRGDSQIPYFSRILYDDISGLSRQDISSGGYVVHTLEASLWCLLKCGSYSETVMEAVNLGQDTDTTAAVAGGLAGTCYGLSSIPKNWISWLAKKEYIMEISQTFCNSLNL